MDKLVSRFQLDLDDRVVAKSRKFASRIKGSPVLRELSQPQSVEVLCLELACQTYLNLTSHDVSFPNDQAIKYLTVTSEQYYQDRRLWQTF